VIVQLHSGVTSAAGSVASESNERAALAVHQATSILDVWYRAIYYALVLARVSGCVGRARAGQRGSCMFQRAQQRAPMVLRTHTTASQHMHSCKEWRHGRNAVGALYDVNGDHTKGLQGLYDNRRIRRALWT
jgi:hypothetical protein